MKLQCELARLGVNISSHLSVESTSLTYSTTEMSTIYTRSPDARSTPHRFQEREILPVALCGVFETSGKSSILETGLQPSASDGRLVFLDNVGRGERAPILIPPLFSIWLV